jgi:serine/threonine-protein phosphatase 4 regulatory subunit 1
LPAVCLALGPERWHELRPTYKALCNINHPRIIASLAASLHEIAKILGAQIAATDLLPAFNEYINDGDDAKTKALAGLPVFISYLPVDRSVEIINDLSKMWRAGSFSNWHHREALASHLAALLRHMASVDRPEPVVELLELGLADTFNAIREATIFNVRMKSISMSFRLASDLPCSLFADT